LATAWAVRQGIGVDASVRQSLAEGLTAVFGAACYLLVRAVEHERPGLDCCSAHLQCPVTEAD